MLDASCPGTQAGIKHDPHEEAHDIRQRIVGLRNRMARDFLELGALLAVVEDYELWRGYAGSFREYCEDPEIGIPYGTARKLIRLHRMAAALGLEESALLVSAGVERSYAVLKASTTREEAILRLHEASCLPVREVQLMYMGDDPQLRAVKSLVRRFEQMNSPSRVTAMVWMYWRMSYHERLEFHAGISRRKSGNEEPEL